MAMTNIESVVKNGLCLGCGICAYSDNIGQTIYSKKREQSIPLLTKENKRDNIGYTVCPGKGYNIINESDELYKLSEYDLELGHVYDRYAIFSNEKDILRNASSGGIM